MVVVCESCSTRFRVDESRIPPKGTLVRCSRCKATFIVKAPEATFEETVQDTVVEVTEAGGSPTPAPSEDLFETAPDDLG
ncbi:MAG: zinc-ribbon domain-containing protein, partial [Myxococcota bacterium]